METFNFNGVNVRYCWDTDDQLYFTASSVFRAIRCPGYESYIQRHPDDFTWLQAPEESRPRKAISWDNLKKVPQQIKAAWLTNNQWCYDGFMQQFEKYVLHKKVVESKPKAQPQPGTFIAEVPSDSLSGAVYKPSQCPSVAQSLFDKVTAALTRGGEEEDSFPKLAIKWGCSEEDCALRMAEMKMARIESGKEKEDSYVDAIGYLVLAYNKYKENQNA